mmetsp:Transcript_52562/g.163124  ORF Transcript_52562/g.163124 Transcript_52562/m.163124 type:complete len:84 (+) Transcript_52562:3912-4163(+)
MLPARCLKIALLFATTSTSSDANFMTEDDKSSMVPAPDTFKAKFPGVPPLSGGRSGAKECGREIEEEKIEKTAMRCRPWKSMG